MSSVVPLRSSFCQSPDLVLSRPFPSALTTMAFDHSRRRWFETCSCKPVPRGRPSSVEQLHTLSPFGPLRSWRTVENIMQVDVGQQGRSYRSLWCPHLRLRPVAVLRNSGLQPFLDQPKYSPVGNPMLEKPQHPLVVHVIEEPADVGIQHPVHLLPLDPDHQRIQRLMLTAPRPRPIREAQKVHLIYLIEDGDHGLLNDLVLQCRDAQRPLSTIGFRNVHSSRWLRLVSAPVNPVMKILDAIFNPGFILLPSHAIHSGSSLTLQRVEAVPKQPGRKMVKQSGELLSLPCSRCSAHTRQSLGHTFPALCRWCAGLMSVLLGQRPSLHALRQRFPIIVRALHWYYAAVRPLRDVHVGLLVCSLRPPACR